MEDRRASSVGRTVSNEAMFSRPRIVTSTLPISAYKWLYLADYTRNSW